MSAARTREADDPKCCIPEQARPDQNDRHEANLRRRDVEDFKDDGDCERARKSEYEQPSRESMSDAIRMPNLAILIAHARVSL